MTHLGPLRTLIHLHLMARNSASPLKLACATHLVLTAEKTDMEDDYSEVGQVHGPDGADLKQTMYGQVQCGGPGSTTLIARVHVAGMRARGWHGHDEIEGKGFASHPVSEVSRMDVADTYLPRLS